MRNFKLLVTTSFLQLILDKFDPLEHCRAYKPFWPSHVDLFSIDSLFTICPLSKIQQDLSSCVLFNHWLVLVLFAVLCWTTILYSTRYTRNLWGRSMCKCYEETLHRGHLQLMETKHPCFISTSWIQIL